MTAAAPRSRAMTEREMLIELNGKFDTLTERLEGSISAQRDLFQEQVANLRREQEAAKKEREDQDARLRKVEERDTVSNRQLWGAGAAMATLVGTIVGVTVALL